MTIRISHNISKNEPIEKLYSMGFNYNGIMSNGQFMMRNEGLTLLCDNSEYEGQIKVIHYCKINDNYSSFQQLIIPFPRMINKWLENSYIR